MVHIASSAEPATALKITVRPNSAINGRWRKFVFALLVPLFGSIGIAFTLIGAWPVLPCLVLTLLGLWFAFRDIERHCGDFEQITLGHGSLVVERHESGRDQRFEFNSNWVKVVAHDAGPGSNAYLALRSHGCELPVGLNLTDDERVSVGRALTTRLSSLQH